MHTFLLLSVPGGPTSSLGSASRSPRTRSGGVRGLDLKKFIARKRSERREGRRGERESYLCISAKGTTSGYRQERLYVDS